MRIRKFEAATVQQAINKAKTELGDRAVILHTRSYPGKFFGLLGKPRVEVTAAVEEQQPRYSSQRSPEKEREDLLGDSGDGLFGGGGESSLSGDSAQAAAHDFLTKIQQIRKAKQDTTADSSGSIDETAGDPSPETPRKSELGDSTDSGDSRFEALEVRLDKLANTMDRLLSLGGPFGQIGVLTEVPDAWHSATKRLLESQISEPALTEICQKLKGIPHPGKELEGNILREVMSGLLTVSPPISKPESGQRVIALVGPTGVGKTTTLAKLASGLVVNSELPTRVGLVTVDTYRLAAVEQLETYAKILNLELQVVFGPEEMPKALDNCRDADIVFIDTAGRSPRDDSQMADLKMFLDKVPGCEKFLVLSSTMNDRYMRETVERFRVAAIDSLIVTKLDETRNYAAPFNIQHLTGIPLSYLTTGQNVPEDIEAVDSPLLAGRIIQGGNGEDLLKMITEPAAELVKA